MTTYTRGAELAQLASRVPKPGLRAFVAALPEGDYAALELELRRRYVAKIKREAAVATFARSRRTAAVDAVPTIEEIEARFGVTHPWDLSAAGARDEAEADRLLALPSPSLARDAHLLDDLPAPSIEEAQAARLAEAERMIADLDTPEPREKPNAAKAAELADLTAHLDLPKNRRY